MNQEAIEIYKAPKKVSEYLEALHLDHLKRKAMAAKIREEREVEAPEKKDKSINLEFGE